MFNVHCEVVTIRHGATSMIVSCGSPPLVSCPKAWSLIIPSLACGRSRTARMGNNRSRGTFGCHDNGDSSRSSDSLAAAGRDHCRFHLLRLNRLRVHLLWGAREPYPRLIPIMIVSQIACSVYWDDSGSPTYRVDSYKDLPVVYAVFSLSFVLSRSRPLSLEPPLYPRWWAKIPKSSESWNNRTTTRSDPFV